MLHNRVNCGPYGVKAGLANMYGKNYVNARRRRRGIYHGRRVRIPLRAKHIGMRDERAGVRGATYAHDAMHRSMPGPA